MWRWSWVPLAGRVSSWSPSVGMVVGCGVEPVVWRGVLSGVSS